ncbi:hypothetical protein K432DRAFT_399013 [Lepidopterella palustris CBS 459.81]|uniref:Uncharacterized protein n=1 Tax=Lepidopterella palustris CBS 459.81 TaxID=1314670 RepID=A0A8E2DX46_9PEZI|nr:hypothetical protein K432DRAFT_399013 [Lepidopterella palustris CBS 459.81]
MSVSTTTSGSSPFWLGSAPVPRASSGWYPTSSYNALRGSCFGPTGKLLSRYPEVIRLLRGGGSPMKIELFQDLYSEYSNLAMSFSVDRPIAIRGLERRLLSTLKTEGGYGIFEKYLHRCLLWQKSIRSLKRIMSFRGETVPSWSWMAYEGGIEYMDVPYGKVDWAKDIVSPFNGTKLSEAHDPMVVTQLKAPIYDLVDSQSAGLVLDETDRSIKRHLKCIIVGTSKAPNPKDQALCYVLLVQEAVDQEPKYLRMSWSRTPEEESDRIQCLELADLHSIVFERIKFSSNLQ